MRNDGHMFGEMKSVSKVREQASEWEKNSRPEEGGRFGSLSFICVPKG